MQIDRVSLVSGRWDSYVKSPEFVSFFFLSIAIVFLFKLKDLYKQNVVLSIRKQITQIVIALLYTVNGLAVIAFFVHSPWIIDNRYAVLFFAIISFSLISTFRLLIFRPIYLFIARQQLLKKRVLIVGADIAARSFAVEMKSGNDYGFELVGFVDDAYPVGRTIYNSYVNLGHFKDIQQIIEQKEINEVIIAVSGIEHSTLLDIIDRCSNTKAHINVASPLFEIVHKKFNVDTYFDYPVAPLYRNYQESNIMFFKRIIDIVGATVGIILFIIPGLIIAAIIKLTSPGPVFYKQLRIGKDGKPFTFYKFRSMAVGSDADKERIKKMQSFIKGDQNGTNGSTKVVNESSITKIGKFLRKTSIDEMPQLINVIKGDMSLVGPRPCLPYEYEAYDEWHKRRTMIIPGCTGLWQVSSRSEVNFDEMVVLDLYYINNMSIFFDIELILKTIPVMVFGRGGK